MKSRILQTKVGTLTLLASQQGLQRIIFGADEAPLQGEKSNGATEQILNQASHELTAYLRGELKEWTVKIHLNGTGTPFQQEVWQALQRIPYGETRSYKDIADQINRPKAVRAIGQANHHNPIPIVIPCHRVVGHNGKLVGYGGGLPLKQKLLELEAS